jgi:hypothetical protein
MASKCDQCPNRLGCDILAEFCRLTAAEVVGQRPDLIRPLTSHQKYYFANKDKYREWNRKAGQKYRANRPVRIEVERRYRKTEKYKAARRAWRQAAKEAAA